MLESTLYGVRVCAIAAITLGAYAVPAMVSAQEVQRSKAIASSDVLSQISMFNYQLGRSSDLLLRPTPILPTGSGTVSVKYEDGNARIQVKVKQLPPPPTLGAYTAYVLWALTPDGRAVNQGVLTGADGDSGSLETRYSAPKFALIVTAEPHFAVSAPSTMIALYNVAKNVKGEESKVTSLTERADYSGLKRIAIDERKHPADIVQAEYAVAIAKDVGAEKYAPRQYAAATEKLTAALAAAAQKRSAERKQAPGLAREAVLAGEDARRAAMIAKVDDEAEAGRRAAAEAAAAAATTAERERAAAAAAEAARAADLAAKTAAEAAGERAMAAARADLLRRLNAVLPTRETSRGLVSEIGGVQFATATANLSTGARESLARFSGVVASYPNLSFRIEGHTDNVGSDATNFDLSSRRAIAVRDYLIAQGMTAAHIDVEGLGSTQPVADNETAEGRARNRRVEIIISGGLKTER